MDWIVIEGMKPYDGRYELDMQVEFTVREWGWIKRLAGYQPVTVGDGVQGADAELFTVFGLIALHRAGKISTADVPDLWERFQDSPMFARIRFETDEAGGEAEPAEDPSGSSPGNETSSGPASTPSSETSATPPNGSGTPAPDSSLYALPTSASSHPPS